MGQYDRHVFVCTSGDTCPTQGDVERYVKVLREGARQAGSKIAVRVNKAGCFSQCGHGPMVVVYPEDVWYAGVKESDLPEILTSHIIGGRPVERLRHDPGVPGANKIDVEKKDTPVAHAPAPQAKDAGPAWTRVCRSNEVPANGMKQFAVDGTNVVIINADAEFFAYQAQCPHEAVPLEDGVHDGAMLTCLEHMWQFDVRTGAPMGDAGCGLKAYPLKEDRGELYVEVDS
jgi:nitrite reductase/ring-hydroxylating ferredoxin subunit/(2Fe-2S) ferredoxin